MHYTVFNASLQTVDSCWENLGESRWYKATNAPIQSLLR